MAVPDRVLHVDYTWNGLYVVNVEGGRPHVCIDAKRFEIPESGYGDFTFPSITDDPEALRYLYFSPARGNDVVMTYTIPAKDEKGRLGVEEVTITIHGGHDGKKGFSIRKPEFILNLYDRSKPLLLALACMLAAAVLALLLVLTLG